MKAFNIHSDYFKLTKVVRFVLEEKRKSIAINHKTALQLTLNSTKPPQKAV